MTTDLRDSRYIPEQHNCLCTREFWTSPGELEDQSTLHIDQMNSVWLLARTEQNDYTLFLCESMNMFPQAVAMRFSQAQQHLVSC